MNNSPINDQEDKITGVQGVLASCFALVAMIPLTVSLSFWPLVLLFALAVFTLTFRYSADDAENWVLKRRVRSYPMWSDRVLGIIGLLLVLLVALQAIVYIRSANRYPELEIVGVFPATQFKTGGYIVLFMSIIYGIGAVGTFFSKRWALVNVALFCSGYGILAVGQDSFVTATVLFAIALYAVLRLCNVIQPPAERERKFQEAVQSQVRRELELILTEKSQP